MQHGERPPSHTASRIQGGETGRGEVYGLAIKTRHRAPDEGRPLHIAPGLGARLSVRGATHSFPNRDYRQEEHSTPALPHVATSSGTARSPGEKHAGGSSLAPRGQSSAHLIGECREGTDHAPLSPSTVSLVCFFNVK